MLTINPTAPGFHGVPEMLGLLDLEGGKIVEFPTVLAVRLFGVSKMNTLKTIVGTLKLLSRLTLLRIFGKSDPIQTSLTPAGLTTAQDELPK